LVLEKGEDMKILVTGGAGYKGVVLVKELLEQGHQVSLLDNFMFGFDYVLHLLGFKSLQVVKEDMRNLKESTVRGYDVIFHLAGLSGYPACEANPHSAKLINVDAARRLCRVLGKEQMLIYASTTSMYGKSGGICTEESEVEPTSLYAITKHQAEKSLLERENTVSLRFATLFGISPKMRVDLLVNDFTFKAVNDRCLVLFESATKRTFLHLKDAIVAYILTLKNFAEMRGHIFNVGHSSMNYSKMEIAEHVRKFTGCKIIDSDMIDFDRRNFVVTFDKIERKGFLPKYSLDDGIAEMVKLYKFYRPLTMYRGIM
jgi:nucleoside-diphosphate-sugar epimerase